MRSFVLLITSLLVHLPAAATVASEAQVIAKPYPLLAERGDLTTGGSPPDGRLGVYAHISKRVLKSFLQREVKLSQTVTEQILNMNTQGTAHSTCQIGLDLVPNSQMANL